MVTVTDHVQLIDLVTLYSLDTENPYPSLRLYHFYSHWQYTLFFFIRTSNFGAEAERSYFF